MTPSGPNSRRCTDADQTNSGTSWLTPSGKKMTNNLLNKSVTTYFDSNFAYLRSCDNRLKHTGKTHADNHIDHENTDDISPLALTNKFRLNLRQAHRIGNINEMGICSIRMQRNLGMERGLLHCISIQSQTQIRGKKFEC